MSLITRLDQVIHLTQQVNEKDWFVIQVLQSMDLLFIKVFHLVRCYYLIVIQVDHFEPVLYAPNGGLVLFAEHEPHEVLVVHFVLRRTLELSGHLVEYPIDCFS